MFHTCSRYAFCPNLTIIDTPGFILKVSSPQLSTQQHCCFFKSSPWKASVPSLALSHRPRMVRLTALQRISWPWSKHRPHLRTGRQGDAQRCRSQGTVVHAAKGGLHACMAFKVEDCSLLSAVHRLILFLQQSSVEWASSLWLNVVQEVDPTFQRTVSDTNATQACWEPCKHPVTAHSLSTEHRVTCIPPTASGTGLLTPVCRCLLPQSLTTGSRSLLRDGR